MKEARCAILGSILGPAEISEQPSVPYVTKLGKRTFQRLDDMKTSVAITLMVPFRGKYCRGLNVVGLDPQRRSATVFGSCVSMISGRGQNFYIQDCFMNSVNVIKGLEI